MPTLVRAAVAVAAVLLGLGGFVAVHAAAGSDQKSDTSDQSASSDPAAKREDGLTVLTTADAAPTPDDDPSPDDSAVQGESPQLQGDSPAAVDDDGQTRTRGDDDGVDTLDSDTRHDDTRGGVDISGHDETRDGVDTSGHDDTRADTRDDTRDDSSGRG